MSISDGLSSYFFRRKMKKTQPMREEMDGKVFFPPESPSFVFVVNMIKVLFPISTLIWRVNNYVSHRKNGMNRRTESTFLLQVFFKTVKV